MGDGRRTNTTRAKNNDEKKIVETTLAVLSCQASFSARKSALLQVKLPIKLFLGFFSALMKLNILHELRVQRPFS